MDGWKCKQEQGRREMETFRRIHRLIKRGYRIDWSVTDVEDAFWLEHPGGAPKLILYSDGMVVAINETAILSPSAKEDRDRIYNADVSDTREFDRWLSAVRLPTWKERTAADREKYIWQPGCIIVLILAYFGFIKLIEITWTALTRS